MSNLFNKKPSLAFCIMMDAIGMLTYAIPFIGEWGDLIWAPFSGILFYVAFGSRGGLIGGVLNFLEEIIPFTDIIPTFTIAWYIQNHLMTDDKTKPLAK